MPSDEIHSSRVAVLPRGNQFPQFVSKSPSLVVTHINISTGSLTTIWNEKFSQSGRVLISKRQQYEDDLYSCIKPLFS